MEDDIFNAGLKVEWTDQQFTIEDIEQQYGFPLIVKTTTETASTYNLPDGETVLLVAKKNPIRLVAQTVEEGHYVMGKQLNIPSEYNGLFKLSNHFEREDIPMQTFRSIQEIADVLPAKVYVQEQLTITLAPDETTGKFSTIVLEKGDELSIINRTDSSGQGNVYKPASRFISRVRRLQHNFLLVHCARLDEKLSLPTSIQGWFATRPPLFVHLLERKGIISLQQIMEQADFPLTVSVSTNSTRSVKDEFLLRSGMHLKLLGLEEHNFVLGVGTSFKIIEFSSHGTTFKIPKLLINTYDSDKDLAVAKNQYQTFVQSGFINSTLQNSPSNVEDYCMSVRFHTPRNRNPTNPRPLNNNAYLRNLTLTSLQQRRAPSNQELSAIHLLTTQSQEGAFQRDKRTSMRHNSSVRRQLPVPEVPSSSASASNPPLPPRNSSQSPGTLPYGSNEPLPPVPPKHRPPLPPNCDPPSLSSAINGNLNIPSDYPQRQPPLPNIPERCEFVNRSEKTSDRDPNEESIFEEFVPRNLMDRVSVPDDQVAISNNDAMLRSNCRPSSLEQLSDLNGSFCPPSVKRVESPCFALKTESDDAPGFNVYENTDNLMSSRRTSLAPTTHDQPPSSTLERPLDSYVVSSSGETGSEKSIASRHSPRLNGVDADDIPLSVASNASSVLDVQSDGDKLKTSSSSGRLDTVAPDWTPPADIKSMDVSQVSQSLRYIGISDSCVQLFRAEMIDGYMLVELTDDILEEDFKLSKLHRFKIKRFIQGWRPKMSNE